jgi:sugar-specific transcriptional regulator TrmB
MIQELLTQLDFNDKEIVVYLAVLEHGKMTPAQVAAKTKINRTTVYSVAKELISRGIIAEDLAGKVQYLVAKPPQDLQILIEKEEKALKDKQMIVQQAIKELGSYSKNTQFSIPKITYIPGEELEMYMTKKNDVWCESVMKYDGILWGFQDHTFAEQHKDWIDWAWKEGYPKDLILKLISNRSDIETELHKEKYKYERRNIKFWKNVNVSASLWIHGDYVVIAMTRQAPNYLVEINDAVLGHNLRQIFKGIWELL